MRGLFFGCGLLIPSLTFAGPYAVGWYKVSSGGGLSNGGRYTVNATIGQPEAGGPIIGDNYSVTGGFWPLVSVVQAAGLPKLTITRSGHTVVVSWPNTGQYNLQQTSSLAKGGWASSPYPITTAGGTNSVTIQAAGTLFLRLQQ